MVVEKLFDFRALGKIIIMVLTSLWRFFLFLGSVFSLDYYFEEDEWEKEEIRQPIFY